jgi:hypothetical protein
MRLGGYGVGHNLKTPESIILTNTEESWPTRPDGIVPNWMRTSYNDAWDALCPPRTELTLEDRVLLMSQLVL